MSGRVQVQFACRASGLPAAREVAGYARAALAAAAGSVPQGAITVRFVDEEEGARLNRAYRSREGATNVLAFPIAEHPAPGRALLGDLAICVPVIAREAREQGKSLRAHCAHMVVHGVLHLLGERHDTEEEASRMEGLEIDVLRALGFADPYAA